MSYKINEIEDAIVRTIKDLTRYKNVKVGTPDGYLEGYNNDLPLILVSYIGAEPYHRMYPGSLSFSIYFVNNRDGRKKIYEMMRTMAEKMQNNDVGLQYLNGFFQLRSDKFYYEDPNYLVFEQQYVCLEV